MATIRHGTTRDMSERDDGLTLLTTLVNFGALTAFLLLHASVINHFVVRRRSRPWVRHVLVPVFGLAVIASVIINANVAPTEGTGGSSRVEEERR